MKEPLIEIESGVWMQASAIQYIMTTREAYDPLTDKNNMIAILIQTKEEKLTFFKKTMKEAKMAVNVLARKVNRVSK